MIKSYFFDSVAPADSSLVIAGMIISGVILLVGLVVPLILHLLRKRKKPVFDLYRGIALVFRPAGLVGLLLFFLRFEGIAPFNYRIWVFISALSFAVWLVIVVRGYRYTVPSIKQKATFDDHFTKYLPTKK